MIEKTWIDDHGAVAGGPDSTLGSDIDNSADSARTKPHVGLMASWTRPTNRKRGAA